MSEDKAPDQERRDPDQDEDWVVQFDTKRTRDEYSQTAYEEGEPTQVRRNVRDDRIAVGDATDAVLAQARAQAAQIPNGKWTKIAAAVCGFVLFLGVIGVAYSFIEGQRVVQQLRSVAVQNCIRHNTNSAVINMSAERPRRGRTPAEAKAGRAIARNLYPILDCRSSEIEGKPVPLAEAEVRKYVALVAKGRSPVVSQGKVVGSRAGLFQGIRSYRDIGVEEK